MSPSISASSYDSFRTCPRLYYFSHVIYLERARDEGARRFGTMYHSGLEAWWRQMDGGDTPWRQADEALVSALKAIGDNARHIKTDPFEVAKAEVMMVAYHARYFELDFESVHGQGDGVELWFSAPLRDEDGKVIPGWRINGRKDVVKRFADGRIKIVDHKSTKQEIHGASDFWARIGIDTQFSMYIDHAKWSGLETSEGLCDASRKPELRPLLKTPEEKRKMTKGKGCVHCGGRAGGKKGVAAGTGKIMIRTQVDGDGRKMPAPIDVEATCTSCDGTGWNTAPALNANQRTEDESPDDYKGRVADEIADDPNAYFRMGEVKRSDYQLAEARADLVMTTGEIGALLSMARQHDIRSAESRRCFPRNTHACTNIYGRRCDFLDVCSGAVNPYDSPLYQVKTRAPKAKIDHENDKGQVVSSGAATAQDAT